MMRSRKISPGFAQHLDHKRRQFRLRQNGNLMAAFYLVGGVVCLLSLVGIAFRGAKEVSNNGFMKVTMAHITASYQTNPLATTERGMQPCGNIYKQNPKDLALPSDFEFPSTTQYAFSQWKDFILTTAVGGKRGLDAVGKQDRQYLFHVVQQTCRSAIEAVGTCKSLELGFALGGSSIPMMEAHAHAKKLTGENNVRSTHYAVDPYQLHNYDDIGTQSVAKYIKDHHSDNSMDFFLVRELSQVALSYFLKSNFCFDVIFIDAGHRYDDIIVDFTFAMSLVSVGGVICLHDTWMGATQAVRSWINTNLNDVLVEVEHEMTDDFSMVAFVKIAQDERVHNHFESFKTDYKNIVSGVKTSTSLA